MTSGLALVTKNEALLWTDGRYFLQAEQELSDQWKLMRIGEDPAVDIWIADVSDLASDTNIHTYIYIYIRNGGWCAYNIYNNLSFISHIHNRTWHLTLVHSLYLRHVVATSLKI